MLQNASELVARLYLPEVSVCPFFLDLFPRQSTRAVERSVDHIVRKRPCPKQNGKFLNSQFVASLWHFPIVRSSKKRRSYMKSILFFF